MAVLIRFIIHTCAYARLRLFPFQLAIAKKYTTIAAGALAAVVVLQAIGYGLLFDISFFFRNLSVIGGLLVGHTIH